MLKHNILSSLSLCSKLSRKDTKKIIHTYNRNRKYLKFFENLERAVFDKQ